LDLNNMAPSSDLMFDAGSRASQPLWPYPSRHIRQSSRQLLYFSRWCCARLQLGLHSGLVERQLNIKQFSAMPCGNFLEVLLQKAFFQAAMSYRRPRHRNLRATAPCKVK
jgi:hypothetical protein